MEVRLKPHWDVTAHLPHWLQVENTSSAERQWWHGVADTLVYCCLLVYYTLEHCWACLLRLNGPVQSVICCCFTDCSNPLGRIISQRSLGWLVARLLVSFTNGSRGQQTLDTWQTDKPKMDSCIDGDLSWHSQVAYGSLISGFFIGWRSQVLRKRIKASRPWKLEVSQITSITFCSAQVPGLSARRPEWGAEEVWFFGVLGWWSTMLLLGCRNTASRCVPSVQGPQEASAHTQDSFQQLRLELHQLEITEWPCIGEWRRKLRRAHAVEYYTLERTIKSSCNIDESHFDKKNIHWFIPFMWRLVISTIISGDRKIWAVITSDLGREGIHWKGHGVVFWELEVWSLSGWWWLCGYMHIWRLAQ